ncbi:hypothetical protein DITRI_Ditri01bG0011400 [Diplodiscus trichospermus]
MAGEKTIENSEPPSVVLKSESVAKLTGQVVPSGKLGVSSDSTSTISSSTYPSGVEGESHLNLVGEPGVGQPISFYNYYYPGYNGSFTQSDDKGYFHTDGQHTGVQSENGSLIYYLSGYNPYATGTLVGVDGQCVGQQPYFSTGYFQPSVSYGSEAIPCYSWDSTYAGDISNGNFDGLGSAFANSTGFNSMKSNGHVGTKLSKSTHTQPNKPLSKGPYMGSDPSAGSFKGYYPAGKSPSFNNPKQVKSYSEDDVHKSMKYDVWSSTPNGNRKLDAAFHEAEARESETGTKCPIFLFFSVNGSGQFVGLAEMIGKVDFNKDMDFWQLDKWNGFFPVKWHVIKDIPNKELCHIILENNENKPVTHSRDTQEIGLKQGLEMLNIFKNYSAKTSLLDDFGFYENREKTLNAKKNYKSATLRYKEDDLIKQTKSGERKVEEDDLRRSKNATDATSLINLTKDLSL